MISTNDQGDIVKVEQHPVTRDEIANKQTDLVHEQHSLQTKLDKVSAQLAVVNQDLADFDRLAGSPPTTGQGEPSPQNNEIEVK